jgi:hypothetical protein
MCYKTYNINKTQRNTTKINKNGLL